MATYTKETALYDTGAIAGDIQEAGTKASKFLSSDSSGIMVYDGTDGVQYPSTPLSTTNNVFIDDNSLDIRKGTQILASFGADGQSFNNEYSEPILEVGYLDTSTYEYKTNWWEYNDENPFTITFPWGCADRVVTSVTFYTEDLDTVDIPGASFSYNDRQLTFSSETCASMIANHVAYISIIYSAEGKFPYYTFGSDGVGEKGQYSTRFGENTVASGTTSLAEGESTTASGGNSHAEGNRTIASGSDSHAEGFQTEANGSCSHAEGYTTAANGSGSHAEGVNILDPEGDLEDTIANGLGSHAEGAGTKASGAGAHTEGILTKATEVGSHAEGYKTVANGQYAHAEGNRTTANGNYAHVEGSRSIADGVASHASGIATYAAKDAQTAIGKYNQIDTQAMSFYGKYALIIGNGTADDARSNALAVDWDGGITIGDHTSPIGTTRSVNLKSNKSVANNTATALLNLELDAGIWLAIVGVRFPSNSTGYRKVNISTTSGANDAQYVVPPASGEVTQIVFPKLLTPTATTTYYLNVRHTAGTSLSMPGGDTLWANYIQAIRIQ